MRVVVHHGRFGTRLADGLARAHPDVSVELNTDEASVPTGLADAEVLIGVRFPSGMLARANRLRLLQLTGVGADHIEPLPATVAVTHAGSVPARSVAEFACMAALCLSHGGPLFGLPERAEEPRRRLLFGGCLVVLGLGRIGTAVAQRGRALGMQVVAVCREPREVPHVEVVTGRDGLLRAAARADALIIALPRTAGTQGLVDEAVIRALPRSSVVVNVGRADVLDARALVEALGERRIAGALLDVHDAEPLPASSSLWDVENLWVTPHCAYLHEAHADDVVALCIENVRRFKSGEPLLNALLERRTAVFA